MKLFKKSALQISFNLIVSILIAIVVFIVIFKTSQVFLDYAHKKGSFDAFTYLELNLKNLYSESDYVKAIELDKPTQISVIYPNIVIPRIEKTIDINNKLIIAPANMFTSSLTLFSKKSEFPIDSINYLFIFPKDKYLLLYNSSDKLTEIVNLELPDKITNLEKKDEYLIHKFIVDKPLEISQICGKKDYCLVIVFNSPSIYDDLLNIFKDYRTLEILHVSGNETFGKVTLASGQNVSYFDRYTLLSAIISNNFENYNEFIKTLDKYVNLTFLVESKRLSYLFDLQPTDLCKNLTQDLNNTLFNITRLMNSLSNDINDNIFSELHGNHSKVLEINYKLKENDCYE